MSNSESIVTNEPSNKKVFYSALGWVGVFLLFIIIVMIAYFPNRAKSFYEETAQERLSIRSEVYAAQAQLTDNYAWENQSAGVVRIPVERAKVLTVAELKEEQASLAK